MKTILSVATLIAMLATPVLAEKTLVKPTPTCIRDSGITYKMIAYHLDQIEMIISEMKQNGSTAGQKPKGVFKKSS